MVVVVVEKEPYTIFLFFFPSLSFFLVLSCSRSHSLHLLTACRDLPVFLRLLTAPSRFDPLHGRITSEIELTSISSLPRPCLPRRLLSACEFRRRTRRVCDACRSPLNRRGSFAFARARQPLSISRSIFAVLPGKRARFYICLTRTRRE